MEVEGRAEGLLPDVEEMSVCGGLVARCGGGGFCWFFSFVMVIKSVHLTVLTFRGDPGPICAIKSRAGATFTYHEIVKILYKISLRKDKKFRWSNAT